MPNRNVALRQARERLVAFAAHDDLLLPDHLALMGELLERHNVAWGYSRPLWVSTDGAIVPVALNLHLADELHTFMEQRNDLPASCIVHTCAPRWNRLAIGRRTCLRAATGRTGRRSSRAAGGRCRYVEQPTCLHFSAHWRGSRHADRPEVLTALQLADACVVVALRAPFRRAAAGSRNSR